MPEPRHDELLHRSQAREYTTHDIVMCLTQEMRPSTPDLVIITVGHEINDL